MRPCGDGGFRRSSPLRGSPPFSGANADSILHPRPGWSSECDSRPGVSIKTFSAHVVIVFGLVVREKRFSTHEESRVVFSPFVKILRFDIGDIDLYPIFVKK